MLLLSHTPSNGLFIVTWQESQCFRYSLTFLWFEPKYFAFSCLSPHVLTKQQRSISDFYSLMRVINHITAGPSAVYIPPLTSSALHVSCPTNVWAKVCHDLLTGDFGEGARNHCFRKQRFGLWPPIWTCSLSCRVRSRLRESHSKWGHFCVIISTSDLWLINIPCKCSFLITASSQRCSVCKCLCVFVLSSFYLKGPEENSSVCFLIRELPSFLLCYPDGGFLWFSQCCSHVWSSNCYC